MGYQQKRLYRILRQGEPVLCGQNFAHPTDEEKYLALWPELSDLILPFSIALQGAASSTIEHEEFFAVNFGWRHAKHFHFRNLFFTPRYVLAINPLIEQQYCAHARNPSPSAARSAAIQATAGLIPAFMRLSQYESLPSPMANWSYRPMAWCMNDTDFHYYDVLCYSHADFSPVPEISHWYGRLLFERNNEEINVDESDPSSYPSEDSPPDDNDEDELED